MILVAIILVETTEGTYPDLSVFVFADAHHLLVGDMIRQNEVLLGWRDYWGGVFFLSWQAVRRRVAKRMSAL